MPTPVPWPLLTHQGFLASSDGGKVIFPRGEFRFWCLSSAGWSLLYRPEDITRGSFGGLGSTCTSQPSVFLLQELQVLIRHFLSRDALTRIFPYDDLSILRANWLARLAETRTLSSEGNANSVHSGEAIHLWPRYSHI